MKRIFQSAGLAAFCAVLLSGCCVADWYHDIVYHDAPLPTTPIAAPAKPQSGPLTADAASAAMTDALIFALCTRSANGIPVVLFRSTSASGSRINESAVYENLLRNRVVRQPANVLPQYLLFSNVQGNVWNITLETVDRKQTILNQTFLLKEGSR